MVLIIKEKMNPTEKHKCHSLENERRRLEKANISKEQRETILAFHAHLQAIGVGKVRIIKLSWQLRKIAEILGKPFEDATKLDIEKVMGHINTGTCTISWKKGKELSPVTKMDYARILKQFYKWLRDTGKDYPPEVSWIKPRLKQKDKKRVNCEHLINWDDIEECTKAANNPKDIAFINFIYESGGRIGEILNMQNKDVVFNKHFATVTLDGKTGPRTITIVTSAPFLARYMHTKKKTLPNSPFWVSDSDRNKNQPLQYAGAVMLIRKLFNEAKINKRCNPHSFRHSIATELSKEFTEPYMREFFGWEKGSDTPSIYVHLSGDDIQKKILEKHGLLKEETTKRRTLDCNVCGTPAQTSNFCSNCGYALTTKVAISLEEKKAKDVDDAMKYMMEIAKSPELMRKLELFKQKAEGVRT